MQVFLEVFFYNNLMNINEILKELQIEKGLSKSKLAKQIGVSQKVLYYWERAVNEPKASYIIMLYNFFKVSTDYLLGIEL